MTTILAMIEPRRQLLASKAPWFATTGVAFLLASFTPAIPEPLWPRIIATLLLTGSVAIYTYLYRTAQEKRPVSGAGDATLSMAIQYIISETEWPSTLTMSNWSYQLERDFLDALSTGDLQAFRRVARTTLRPHVWPAAERVPKEYWEGQQLGVEFIVDAPPAVMPAASEASTTVRMADVKMLWPPARRGYVNPLKDDLRTWPRPWLTPPAPPARGVRARLREVLGWANGG